MKKIKKMHANYMQKLNEKTQQNNKNIKCEENWRKKSLGWKNEM